MISAKKQSRRQSKRRNHTLVLLGVGLVFIALTTLLKPFYSTQLWLSDQLFLSETPSPNIVVSGIDDATLQAYGKWSDWPRRLHAQALDNLAKAGARAIGFDILFADSSADDAVFATAIENAGKVVLPIAGSQPLSLTGSMETYTNIIMPVPALSDVSRATGHVNISPDRDNKVRSLPLVIQDTSGKIYPSFILSAQIIIVPA